jgi:hypothetical protein
MPNPSSLVARRRSCFVISPIGAHDSETRKHADAVFEYIIEPATRECGVIAHRSDHLRHPGRISDEMHARILNDDMCIAILTERNPNVYYELAIAQSAGRPVIMLLQRGEEIPFDIQDFRLVTYDFLPERLIKERLYVKEVIQHIKAIEESGWKVICHIPGMADAWKSDPVVDFYPKSSAFGPHAKWMSLLHQTSKRYSIMGISLRVWQEGENLSETLLQKASNGCDVRVLLLHPDNPVLPQLINESRPEERIDRTRLDINEMYRFMLDLCAKNRRIAVRRIMIGCPLSQITITDASAVFVPYMYGARTSASPLWQARANTPLYSALVQEFEAVWSANASEGSLI